jgi:putative peptidoglycan lipid II flippase
MIATLFYSGEFGANDVEMARLSLMAYSLGLVAFMGIKVLAPGYYARQDMKTPVRIAVIALVTNMVFNLILMFPFGHAGLAAATTIAAITNAGLLLRGLLKDRIFRPKRTWIPLMIKALIANLLMGLVISLGVGVTADWIAMGLGERIWRLLMWILIGGAVYAAALLAMGIRPRHFMGRE